MRHHHRSRGPLPREGAHGAAGDPDLAACITLARLDRVAPTRELAQIGAALGRSFSHELINAVS
jgi:hypothetical protein